MKGLRFYRKSVNSESNNGFLSFHHSEIESNRSDFDYIFRSIFTYFKDKFLLNDELPIFDPDYENKIFDEFTDFIVQHNEQYVVAKGLILESCGQNIPEFEGNLLILVNDPPPKMTWREFCEYEDKNSMNIFCLLSNWDGIYWDIYTNQKPILDALLYNHANDTNLEIYYVDSEVDYPDPTRSKAQLQRA